MKVIFKKLFSAFILFFATLTSADDFTETSLNNEASGYVNMLQSFVQKATTECHTLLQQDDSWRENLVQEWQQNNQEYVEAVDQWTNFYLNRIRNHSGEGVAQYEQQKIKSVIEMRGTNITREIITGNTQEKTVACEDFEAKLTNGELNINEKSPHYPQLLKMVEIYQ